VAMNEGTQNQKKQEEGTKERRELNCVGCPTAIVDADERVSVSLSVCVCVYVRMFTHICTGMYARIYIYIGI